MEHLQALLPQYEIISMLGHGGMGAVYKGKQKSLDRMVAIKILPPGMEDDDANFTERFKNEARTMAKMMHPGIVAVFDFGEIHEGGALAPASAARTPRPSDATSNPTDSSPSPAAAGGAAALPSGPPLLYFIMEYVDGTDVAKMIQASGKLPADHALAITAHVCDALAYAHSNGVIHRDIKPANILINMQGQVKVADFGLAKMDDPSQTSGLTKTGMAMGTPDYVAPEALIMGVNVDGRADLYAIGVMLYQMLTGEIPRGLFLMPSVKTNGEIDPRFDKIITRAMQTDREARYQQATEIRKDLDVILTAPRVKQDASKAVAAVPQGAVKNVPGQRSAAQPPPDRRPGVAQPARPAHESPNAPGKGEANAPPAGRAKATPGLQSAAAPGAKSKTGLWLGLAAGAVVLIGGAVFFLGGDKQPMAESAKDDGRSEIRQDSAAKGTLARPATSTGPVKVAEPPKKPSAAPSPAIATTNASPQEQWVDVLKEYLARPADKQRERGIESTPEGVKFTKAGATFPFNASLREIPNVALRATVRGVKGGLNLVVRTSGTPPEKNMRDYQAILQSDGSVTFKRYDMTQPGPSVELSRSAPIPGFSPDARHIFEFRAVGDVLTATLDGGVLEPIRDASFTNGGIGLVGYPGMIVEKLEVADLTGVKPAAAEEQWVDVLKEYFARPADQRREKAIEPSREGGKVTERANFNISPGEKQNVALRATVRGMNNDLNLGVRGSGGVTAKIARNYRASFAPDGSVRIIRYDLTQPTVDTELSKSAPIPGFSPDARHTFEFRAVDDVLTATVDGRVVGPVRDASFTKGGLVFVGNPGMIVEKLEMADLTGVKTAAASAGGGGEKWVDALAEVLAKGPGSSADALAKVADGVEVKRRDPPIGLPLGPRGSLRDYALRARVRPINVSLQFSLRTAGSITNGDMHSYVADFKSDGSATIRRRDANDKFVELGAFPAIPGFDKSAWHSLEFRAEGEVLTLRVDEQTVGTVRDSTFSSGGAYFVCDTGMIIEKLEYADLTGVKPAAAVASSSLPVITGWQDLMGAAKKEIPRVGQTGVKEDNGWLVASNFKGTAGVALGEKHFKDTAMRGRVRGYLSAVLRHNEALPGNYIVRFQKNGTGSILQLTSNPRKETVLASFTMSSAPEHDFLVTMTGPDIRLWVDGTLAATARDTTIASGVPGITLAEEGAAFRDLAVAELPADFASKLAPVDASGGPWIDAIAKVYPPGTNLPSSLVREGAGIYLTPQATGAATLCTLNNLRDFEIRITARCDSPKGYWNISARDSSQDGKRSQYVMNVFSSGGGKVDLQSRNGKLPEPSVTLGSSAAPPGFDITKEHTLHVRLQGTRIIVRLNEAEVINAEDATASTGQFFIYSQLGGIHLSKIEYRELPPAKASAAAASGSEKWVDGLAEWWADPKNTNSARMVKEAGGSRQVDAFGAGIARDFKDVALRVRAVGGASTDFYKLNLRLGNGGYQAHLKKEGKGFIYRGEVNPEGKMQYVTLASFDLPAGFSITERHEMEFSVIKDVMELFLDGQKVATARDSVRTHGAISIEGKGALFEKFEYRELGENSAAPAPAVASGEKWIDALTPALASWKGGSSWKPSGTGLVTVEYQGFGFVPTHFTDIAVRATARCSDANGLWQVRLRATVTAEQGQAGYKAILSSDGQGRIQMETGGKPTDLQTFTMPAGFSITDSHTMEFRAQGDRLSLAVDGREVATAQDSTLRSGLFNLLGQPGTVFEKVEYRELTGSPGAAASSEKWIDGLAEWMSAGNKGDVLEKPDASGARLVAKPLGVTCGTASMKDVSIRATLRAQTVGIGDMFGFVVRGQIKGDGYLVKVDGKSGRIHRQSGGQGTVLKAFEMPAGISMKDTHTAEFRAQGGVLTFLLDGQELGRAQDTAFTSGSIYFLAQRPNEILLSKLEYRELPAAPAAVSPKKSAATPAPPPAAPGGTLARPATTEPPPLPAELAALDAQFIKLQAERVAAPFEAEMAKLNASYVGGIARKITEEKTAGHLDAVLALEAEQKLLADKQPVPESDDDKTPAGLKDLRKIYRDAFAKLVATQAANLKDLIVPLEKRLVQMETDLTKADRLADAKTVRAYREALTEDGAGASAPASPAGTTGASTRSVALAGASALPKNVSPASAIALRGGITNTLGMKLVPVPGTDVLMCIHETRYKDYAAYATEVQGVDAKWKDQTIEGIQITDRAEDHPVINTSWDDAQAFCAWLGKKEGRTYRLPTDKEWSFAVGIGRKEKWGSDTPPASLSHKIDTEWPWGENFPPRTRDKAGNYNDMSHDEKNGSYLKGYKDGYPTTAPVMSFKPNKLGIYDLGGNLFEWVEDWYDGEQKERTLRGASWSHADRGYLLSSGRFRSGPGARTTAYGFRVVWVPGSAAEPPRP
ncbi:MAG: SUMF1/EgtB/PvdO family nonheme iron enzyme [Verrucomicrobiaceae bacterium]|nr:SUMF1/EgtB/PvdO family nonheme iron enzyme [Verrucomicrobiaceae bacterium]